jgi:hypothetical protein
MDGQESFQVFNTIENNILDLYTACATTIEQLAHPASHLDPEALDVLVHNVDGINERLSFIQHALCAQIAVAAPTLSAHHRSAPYDKLMAQELDSLARAGRAIANPEAQDAPSSEDSYSFD